MFVRSTFRGLAAASIALTGLTVFTPCAYADAVRFGVHPGYGRIAFDWDSAVRYSASVIEDTLVVQFDRPLIIDISQAPSRLTPYVTGVRLEDGGKTAYFNLKPGVTMKTFTLKNIVVVDLSSTPGFGEQRLATAPLAPLNPPVATAQVPLAPVPTVPVPSTTSERVPLAELAGPQPETVATTRYQTAEMPRENPLGLMLRPRAEVGMTYYDTKLVKGDVAAQFGAALADDGFSDTTATTATTGDTRSVLALPHRIYAEGTLGLTASTGPWYSDFYWRMALKNRTQPKDASVLVTRDTFTPDTPFGPQSATRTTTLLDYESRNSFKRNQFGVTFGRTFWDTWSVFGGYRYAKLISTSNFSRASTVNIDDYPDATALPLTGDPAPRPETATSTTAGRTSQTRFTLTTQSPTIGIGYTRALDEDARHVLNGGVGAAYSFAKLHFRQLDGETTESVLDRSNGDVITTETVAAAPNAAGVTGLTPGAFGFWMNLGYQFRATPQLTFSVNGDAYRFRYGNSVLGNTGERAGNLQELSLSGRLGVSLAFGPN